MKQKRPPGPVGTSCLTCKRRRKKCDQRRPVCERCDAGGYDCLGYDHIQRCALGSDPERSPSRSESVEGTPYPTVTLSLSSDFPSGNNCTPFVQSSETSLPLDISTHGFTMPAPDFSLDGHAPGDDFETPVNTLSRASSAASSPPSLALVNHQPWAVMLPPTSCLATADESEAQHESQSNPMHTYNLNSRNSSVEPWLARNISPMSPDIRELASYVISQYERVIDAIYFKPKRQQMLQIWEIVCTRLQESSITRCAALLGAKIIESLLNGTSSTNRVTFGKLVQRFEQQLCAISAQIAAPDEVQHRLNGFLEVAFLKMRTHRSSNAYQLTRNAAPTFLRIIYSDPALWPNPYGPPAVSLARVVASDRYELGHFAMVDIICAMAYGLPQTVDYDTSTPVLQTDINPLEWVHACPTEFLICLAEMTYRCANNYVAHDWHLIEQRLLTYKPSLSNTERLESWRTVARLAVIESWRQVLLIYLYMAVCGVASDDSRVQSAVRQIFQLFGTVKRQDPPKINVHFVSQYLIAGACTRNEKQRAYVRERLSDAYDNEYWVLPGTEFVPVLDHLWHGAAANGRPIKWGDYITSRQTALPISI